MPTIPGVDYCNTFWGSHGCSLDPGHDDPHVCGARASWGPCSIYENGMARFYFLDRPGELSEPKPMPEYHN
jgi:hypothetical protein